MKTSIVARRDRARKPPTSRATTPKDQERAPRGSCHPHRRWTAIPAAAAAMVRQPPGHPPQDAVMFNANAFTIRPARTSDEPTLDWLAALSSRPAVARPALIGDIDGIPAAAISRVDGRIVADPF